MSMKDLWFGEYERIGNELRGGDITRGVAVERWTSMGLDRIEAEETADVAEKE